MLSDAIILNSLEESKSTKKYNVIVMSFCIFYECLLWLRYDIIKDLGFTVQTVNIIFEIHKQSTLSILKIFRTQKIYYFTRPVISTSLIKYY